MILHPTAQGSRNAPQGRCSGCKRLRTVFAVDGTDVALCAVCVACQVDMAAELLATRELYEGSTAQAWLEVHNRHAAPSIGCPWCGMAAQ
jgi:hypothetical protein